MKGGRTMKKKTLWILSMVALCLVLYTIVLSRMENSATIIFGGTEGGFVRTDGINFAAADRQQQ